MLASSIRQSWLAGLLMALLMLLLLSGCGGQGSDTRGGSTLRRIMLLVAAAIAMAVLETLSIGVASAQQASSASPTSSCSNMPTQTIEYDQPSTKECGQPAISVSTISLDFGSVTVGTNSGPQYLTLTNTGNVPVNIVVSFSENNPPYIVTGDNCQNLSPEQSCQIQAIFYPRKIDPTTVIVTLVGRPGSGSLPDSTPQIVSLTGVGV